MFHLAFKVLFWFDIFPWFRVAVAIKNLTDKVDVFTRKSRCKNTLILNFNIRAKQKKIGKEPLIISKVYRLHNFSSLLSFPYRHLVLILLTLYQGQNVSWNWSLCKSLSRWDYMIMDYSPHFLQNNLELSPSLPSFFKNLNPYNYRKIFTLC